MFTLAQTDPVAIGDALGKSQDIQQVLGIIIGVLIAVVLALVTFYLRERKGWGGEKVKLVEAHGEERLAWEKERGAHAGRLAEVADVAADGREGLMREMLELALRIEKALDRLATWKEARGEGP